MKSKDITHIIILLLLTAICLSGCIKTESTQNSIDINNPISAYDNKTLSHVYKRHEYVIPDSYRTLSQSMSASITPYTNRTDGTITIYVQDMAGTGHVLKLNHDSGVIYDISVPLQEGQTLCAGCFHEDTFWYVTAVITRDMSVQDSNYIYLHVLSLNTSEVYTSEDLKPYFNSIENQTLGLYISSVTIDINGNIWLGSAYELIALDSSFAKLHSFYGSYGSPMYISAAEDGTVWCPERNRLNIYDLDSPNENKRIQLSNEVGRVVFCDGYDFCYQGSLGVYGVITTEDIIQEDLLMDFGNSNVDSLKSSLVAAFNAENLVFVDGTPVSYSLYCVSDDIILSDLDTIYVAFSFDLNSAIGSSGFTTKIVEYNKKHPDRKVILTDYSTYNTSENPDGGAQKLMIDILTGIYRPDIVIDRTSRYMMEPQDTIRIAEQLVSRGLYRDLSPFMEKDEEVNRNTLFGSVQRVYSTKTGEMWGICANFSVETLISPTALMGEYSEGWTMQQFLKCVEKVDNKELFLMGGLTKENAIPYTIGNNGLSAFINKEDATCTFDSPEFIDWLNFYASLPQYNRIEKQRAWTGKPTFRKSGILLF